MTVRKSPELRWALIWSFIALLLQYGSSLLVLPALLRYLTPQEIGVWYAYQLILALAGLLEFGYQVTFVRNISYVAHGATDLAATGVTAARSSGNGQSDHGLMQSVVMAMNMKYLQIARLMFFFLLTIGSAYIYFLTREIPGQLSLLPSWIVLIVFSPVSFYVSRQTTLLTGLNEIAAAQLIQVISKLAAVLTTYACLWLGLGLTGAAIGFLVSGALIIPLLSSRALRKSNSFRSFVEIPPTHDPRQILQVLRHNANKTGWVSLGGFVVVRATSVVASFFLPLEDFAALSVTLQLFQVLTTVSRVKTNISMPTLSGFVSTGDIAGFKQLFLSCFRLGLGLYLAGTAVIVLIAPTILYFIDSRVKLVDGPVLYWIAGLYLLENVHGTCAWCLTCFNEVAFVRATWFTGVAIIVSAAYVLTSTSYGVTGMIVAQVLCQLAYNSWKWPLAIYIKTR